jgi:hypothetical protein
VFARPANGSPYVNNQLKQLIESLFTDFSSARTVGLKYLAQHPKSASGAIERVQRYVRPVMSGERSDLRECLVKQQQNDFSCGDSIIIDGWVFARSEADLCATLVLGPTTIRESRL